MKIQIHSSTGDDVVSRAEQEEKDDLAIARAHDLWPKAVAYLRDTLSGPGMDVIGKIRASIAEGGEYGWIAPYHFGWGMGMRNALQEAGFGEQQFGVKNLDNIYVKLIEEAVAD